MPKIRTRRAAAKRFSLTGKGKIKRFHAFSGHLFTGKSPKRKRGLRQSATVAGADVQRVLRMIG